MPLTHPHGEAHRRPLSRSTIYLLVVIYASMFAAVAGGILYTRQATSHSIMESERKWCATVTTLDDSYRQTPPQTESGRQVAARIRELRESFQCDQRRAAR